MDSKKLRAVREAYKERQQLKEKIVEFENMRVSPRGAVYGERVQTSPKGDVQPDNIARLDELLEKYNAALAECVELIYDFEKALECLNSRERRIMRLYYIDGLTWEKICVEENISWTNHHRIKNRAYEKMGIAQKNCKTE